MPYSLHVAHAVLSLDCGGLERTVIDLVREGQRLGQQVSVLCLERPGTWGELVESLGARLICIYKPPGLKLQRLKNVQRVISDLRPDVLHTHQITALFYTGPVARELGVPVVVHTEQGNHLRGAVSSIGRLRLWLLMWLATRHVARFFGVSEDIAATVRAFRLLSASKVSVIPNAVDTGRFGCRADTAAVRTRLGIPVEATVVGTVGRLNEIKRQDLLIRAFADVRSRLPAAHLLLVGDGPLLADLRALAAILGVGDSVHFAGYQADPVPYLQAMDIFALTSRIEGTPLSVLEAWAAGLPVVAARVGGLVRLVGDERSGLLFDGGDQRALADAICALLLDPDRARKMGETGRQRAYSQFSVTTMAKEYQRHYIELLEARRPLSLPRRAYVGKSHQT
jgi:glycosyltransferase involved in cell wall biosynthesis